MQPTIKNLHWLIFFAALFFIHALNAQTTHAKGGSELKCDTEIITIKKIICKPRICAPTKTLVAGKVYTDTLVVTDTCCCCLREQCIYKDSAAKNDETIKDKEQCTNNTSSTDSSCGIINNDCLNKWIKFILKLGALAGFLISLFGLGKEAKKTAKTGGMSDADKSALATYIPLFCVTLSLLIALLKFILIYFLLAFISVCGLVFIAVVLYFQYIKYNNKENSRKFETDLALLTQINKLEKNDLNPGDKYTAVKEGVLLSIAGNFKAPGKKTETIEAVTVKLAFSENIDEKIARAIAEGRINDTVVTLTTDYKKFAANAFEHSNLDYVLWNIPVGSYLINAAIDVMVPPKSEENRPIANRDIAIKFTGSFAIKITNETTMPVIVSLNTKDKLPQ